MSTFEIAVTPPRIQNARKISASREVTDVVLGLFSAKSIVTFEDIPVTKSARRILHIHNPTNDILKVQVTKTINVTANVTLEWTSNEIPAGSSISMEIVWNPLVIWSTRETIQFTDNRNFKKNVVVILKSIDKTQNKKNMLKNALHSHVTESRMMTTKKSTSKSPSPRTKRNRLNAIAASNRSSIKKENTHQRMQMKKVLGANNQSDGLPTVMIFNQCSMSFSNGAEKENFEPKSPKNTSVMFDSINFTPVGKNNHNISSVDYLASLPTPNSNAPPNQSNILQNVSPTNLFSEMNVTETLFTTPFKINDQTTTFTNFQTPIDATEVDHANCFENIQELNQFAMQMTPGNDIGNNLPKSASDIGIEPRKFNFELTNQSTRMEMIDENQELNFLTTINRTQILSSPITVPQLSVIEEEHSKIEMSETYITQSIHHLTYNVEEVTEQITEQITQQITENLARDVRLVGTPLQKKFQSMRELNGSKNDLSLEQRILKNNQGSMPNLYKLEAVKSIENNRYFCQSIEKDLQQTETIEEKLQNDEKFDDEIENLGDTSICSMKSTVSTQSVAFQEHEILAQSSRVNLNEIGRNKVVKLNFNRNPTMDKSTKPILTKKHLSVSSPTVNKIPSNKIQTPKLSQSIRDIRSDTSISKTNRPSVIYYVNGASSAGQKKRNRDETSDSIKKSTNKYSPPKRTRMDPETKTPTKGQAIRTKTWGAVMPKKIQMPSVPPQRLILNRPEEERVILFDPELHLRGVINPDPFAATTVFDPFLSATMYLDERAVDKHEVQFKKWLNALVTIPGEMDENANKTLDVGKLFNEVKNKDCTLAPTKETVSANYLTKYRLNSLRTAAIHLYTSNEMRESLSKLLVHIERKAIHIRQDRNLHLDVVLQRSILELLLNFNPLWLRIGLEVVFGELIPMSNNHDVVSLSAFILNRLFRDRYLELKHPKVYAQGDIYAEHIKKHTLKKFLCLLYFLDVAKNKKMIKHNPCLFLKSSAFKETKEILLRFSSSLLGNIGDVQRDLKRIGIVLTHKQTYIDEFDYAFRNLAIDLRDGVRLTRVMEIILMRDNLTCQLRVPAISRIQRIHNVGVALKALESAEFHLTGKIIAADIADGHREKTLSLLWQIIYRFRAPKFHAAAAIIQNWWHSKWLSVCIRRRIRAKIQRIQIEAATKIQSMYRSYRDRKMAKLCKIEQTQAAIIIQKYTRRYLAMKEFVYSVHCVIFIQRYYRNKKITETIRNQFVQLKSSCCVIQKWYRRILLARKIERFVPILRKIQEESQITVKSAILLQRKFRSFMITKQIRTEFIELKTNVLIVQRRFRALLNMRHQRNTYLKQRESIIYIQRKFRANIAMKVERNAFQTTRNSTIRIQNWYRACRLRDFERERYLRFKNAAIILQQRYRAHAIAISNRKNFLEMKRAAICIQHRFRAQKAMQEQRKNFLDIQNKTIIIQRKLRATILMKKIRSDYQELSRTVIMLQRRFRANRLAHQYKFAYEKTQNAVRWIQTKWRANVKMRQQRAEFMKLQSIATFLQTKYRAKLLGRSIRNGFVEYKSAVINIQRRFRANQLMRHEKENYCRIHKATLVIQRKWKGELMKRQKQSEFQALKQATLVVQRRYKALNEMKKQRSEYLRLRESVIVVQTRFRANLLMRKHRSNYLNLRKSCTVIQERYRANILMQNEKRSYQMLQKYAIIVQRRFRANRLADDTQFEYLKLKGAAMTIQQRFRARQTGKKVQHEYQRLKNAVISIQRIFRNRKLMEKQKMDFNTIRTAAIIIQRRFRARKAMKLQQADYRLTRETIISVQRRFRANVLMRKQRMEFLKLKSAAICIQQRYRAKQQMKEKRSNYILQRLSAIYIQRRYRELIETRHQRVNYLIVRRSVITIQRFIRGYLQMKCERDQFLNIRTAVITIQRRYIAYHQMKQLRSQYLLKLRAVCMIQSHFRSYMTMKRQRYEFIRLREATICLQRRYLSLIQMREQRNKYIALQNATICIQRRWRAKLLMKKILNQYQLLKCLVICVQRKFRAKMLMEQERAAYLRLKWAACIVQQKYRSKRYAIDQREKFSKLRAATVNVQAHVRGHLARKRFQMLMTPELIEKRRQIKAAKKIQSFWRGYRIRKTRSARLRAICEKSKILQKTATIKNMVKHRVDGIVKFLKQRYNVKDALAILRELEYISLTIPHTLIVDSVFIGSFCYGIMSQAIRSEIDKQLISLCCRVLLNLARYKPTRQNVFQINHFETVAQILYRWCDKDTDIFNVLCTVLHVFIQSPEINERMREFMVTREAIFLLRETKKLVARKERMRAITPPAWMPILTPKERRTLPMLETNFGVRKTTNNYIFNCSVFGFDTILSEMNIII